MGEPRQLVGPMRDLARQVYDEVNLSPERVTDEAHVLADHLLEIGYTELEVDRVLYRVSDDAHVLSTDRALRHISTFVGSYRDASLIGRRQIFLHRILGDATSEQSWCDYGNSPDEEPWLDPIGGSIVYLDSMPFLKDARFRVTARRPHHYFYTREQYTQPKISIGGELPLGMSRGVSTTAQEHWVVMMMVDVSGISIVSHDYLSGIGRGEMPDIHIVDTSGKGHVLSYISPVVEEYGLSDRQGESRRSLSALAFSDNPTAYAAIAAGVSPYRLRRG